MKKIIAYLYIFSLLFSSGCQFGVNEKQAERDKTEYDLCYLEWKFIGKDLREEIFKCEKKENILLNFETNVKPGSIFCISKGSGIMAANQNSIPKYDTIKSKNKNIEVGFTSADLGGFIRFRIFPNLHDAEQNSDKLLLDIEYRIDIKKNKEEKVVEPYDLVLTKYVNFQWKKEVKELEADAGILIEEWQKNYDLDGDKIADSISYQYTGGASCCYNLNVNLTKFHKTLEIPFLIDGGYMLFDLSKKDNFNIIDKNKDGIYEIFINLNLYEQDRSQEEFDSLKKKYQFKTNEILLHFEEGKILVRDFNKN